MESSDSGKKMAFAALVGAILSEERESRGTSQATAAKDAGLAQSTWARMELGRACTLENLAKASALFGFQMWQLLRVAEDRANGLRNQGIEVVYDLPTDDEMKEEADHWLTGSSIISKASLLALAPMIGPVGWSVMAGVAAYTAWKEGRDSQKK